MGQTHPFHQRLNNVASDLSYLVGIMIGLTATCTVKAENNNLVLRAGMGRPYTAGAELSECVKPGLEQVWDTRTSPDIVLIPFTPGRSAPNIVFCETLLRTSMTSDSCATC